MNTDRLMPFSIADYSRATCRTRHQAWANTLRQSEQEIDQLLTLLADLPEQTKSLQLQSQTVQYESTLNRLKNHIQHLRTDMICAGSDCNAQPGEVGCTDVRFVPQASEVTIFSGLSAEVGRIKERCQSFLGKLVGLNLI
jgi:hypothetical protein